VGGGQGDVEIQRLSENLVIARHHGFAWVHCGEVTPQTASPSVYDRSTDAFRRMRDVLASAGVGFEQVIRTWLYLGDIVGPEGQRQRYQELNRARTDFYRDIRFLATHGPQDRPVYPASTGIGSNDLDVRMSCIALVTGRADVTVTPLENPQQTSACEYGLQYGPKSPKFSRAIVVAAGPSASIFISGTASITGQESRHEDAAEQTRQTLDNIETLIAEANCRRHGLPGRGATLAELALARVYIKRPEDFECVRAVCRGRLGELPTIYAVADICRPELLVEIEGIAFSGSRLLVG
jgi:enamine deaminase RidA (YjgF/YER057c/UK114 family)